MNCRNAIISRYFMMNKKLLSKSASSLIILLLSIFIYSQIASRIIFAPLDFDEGYNLQISYNLSRNFLNYATFDNLFDTNITTGPSLLIPATFLISSSNPLLPRLIMLIFATVFIYICQVYMYTSQRQRIIFLILIIFTPLFYFFSSHVIGELPGFVFFLISLIALSKKKYFLAGLLMMLGIFTKSVYVFGIPVIILEFFLIHIFFKSQRINISRNAALLISGSLIILFIWQIYVLSAAGFSYHRFTNIIQDNWKAANALSQPKLSLIDKRVDMLSYVFGMHGVGFIILLFMICRITIKRLRENFTAVSLAFFSICYTLYFLFLGTTNWYRHFFPVILAMIVITPLCIDMLLNEKKRSDYILLGIVSLFMIISYFTNLTHSNLYREKRTIEQNLIFYHEQNIPFSSPHPLLTSQLQTSAFINKLPQESVIAGVSWWNAPEISYLAGKKITRDPFAKDTHYLITHYYGEILGKSDYEYLKLLKNKGEIFSKEGYKIYKLY